MRTVKGPNLQDLPAGYELVRYDSGTLLALPSATAGASRAELMRRQDALDDARRKELHELQEAKSKAAAAERSEKAGQTGTQGANPLQPFGDEPAPDYYRVIRKWAEFANATDDAAKSLRSADSDVNERHAKLRALLIASFGAPHHYDTALDRGALLRLAAERGVETPQFCALRGGRDAAAAHQLGFPLVLKREGTCGGAGIVMVTRADDFASAYARLARKARLKRAALMLTGQAVGAGPPLIAQAFAPGVLGMTAIACANGAVLESASFLSERQDPPGVGASTIVRPVEHPAMEAAAATLAGALRCSGFVSFDFICSPDGGASLIEMNARPIALTHLGAWSGRDVAAAYLRALTGLPPAARTEATVLEPIALFPRDLVRDPAGSEATGARLDVNWDDPPVLAKHAAALVRRHPAARERLLARLAAATAIAAE